MSTAKPTSRKVQRISLPFVLVFLALSPSAARADAQDCMAHYYREKSAACIDQTLAQLPPGGDPTTVLGFLAQIFKTAPEERERLLRVASSDHVKSVEVMSLYWAGLPDEAERFAAANNLSALSEKMRSVKAQALDDIRPFSTPGHNDLLIGAYMASGRAEFIGRILDNYSSTNDEMASDAFRIGLMMSKFGPNLAPKGRSVATMQAACEKYHCKSDQKQVLRLLTLASAMWSLQSLAQRDDGVKQTLSDFFARDSRLKTLFATEQTAFGNYLVAVVALAAFKEDEAAPDARRAHEVMSKSASIFENLGSAREAFAPMLELKK